MSLTVRRLKASRDHILAIVWATMGSNADLRARRRLVADWTVDPIGALARDLQNIGL
jgi:hypothetical protein